MNLTVIVDLLLLALTLVALWFGVRLHSLLRAGELGRAWQFIVFGVISLVLKELLRLGNQFMPVPGTVFMERVAEAGFMVLLCYALWRQWSAFEFLHGRQRKRTRWDRVAKSFEALSEREYEQTQEGQETPEKEWREQWYRKA
ncbi:MAG: hypothetical protein N2116_01370 [Armatimonadetes bacterium]|nr:hypothetical protein [Armatimonadota bacterium]